jgi:flagellar hook assembly protein FlgD
MESRDVAYVELRTDKSSYSAGQEVKIAFSLVNDKPGNISLASLGYTLEISGSQGVVLIVTESHSSSEPVSVEASSQAFVGTFVWDQRDMKGNQVPQGDYTVRVHLLDASFQGATQIKIE